MSAVDSNGAAATREARIGYNSETEPVQLRILTLSCVYPNPGDPSLGLFVRARLQRMADTALIKIIAPVPRIDYAKRNAARLRAPFQRWDNQVEVFHPEWFYPPGGHALNAVLLHLQSVSLAQQVQKEFRFDLIDAHFAFPDGIAACLLARRFRVPFTVTLRGNETMHANYPVRRRLMAWALKRASRVIAVSSRLRDFAMELGVDAPRIRVIPNGVDSTIFHSRDRKRIREEYGISGAEKIVLSAGTLIERKGHHHVVRAVAALRREGAEVTVLIAGGPGREGKFEDEIRNEVEKANLATKVHFLGEAPAHRLAGLMSAADVFCLASSREGWPNVVHEALACGTPVVATDVGAVRDLIPSPEFGSVVPFGDDVALEHALGEALRTEWDRGKISAWAHARSWEQVAREVISEFESAVEIGSERKAVNR